MITSEINLQTSLDYQQTERTLFIEYQLLLYRPYSAYGDIDFDTALQTLDEIEI